MNSLYGRFGMDPVFEHHEFVDENQKDNILDKNNVSLSVKDLKELDNSKYLISYSKIEGEDMIFKNKRANVSISIASAITAYARIFMAKHKNNPNYKIFYTDTDSIFTDKPIESNLIGSKLGQFKLEYVFKEAIFLAPKVYGGITGEGKEITKVKGFKNKITFNELKELLNKNKTLNLNQNK
jgi:hypothetical protein